MYDASSAKLHIEKSTIVRSNWMQSTVRPLMRGLSHLAPTVAAKLAGQIFLRPPKSQMPTRERWWATEAEEMQVLFGAGRLTAWRWGWGGQRRVLLVHGWGGRGLQLGALALPLVEAGFEVVAYDAPGHGLSTGERSSLPEMAEAVGTMVRSLGGVDGIVAHSFGASACTTALNHLQMAPDVQRLIYISPAVDMIGLTEQFADLVGLTPLIALRIRQGIEQRFGVPFEEFQGLRIARNMKHPLLVIHDRGDREVAFGEGEALVGSWSGAELMTTEGLGHRRILRAPEVIERTLRFLDQSD